MILPKPGVAVRGSKTGQPVMALLDLLGRSWAMGIIWHLNEGPSTFRRLQQYCESISPTTLNKRLKELMYAHLIVRTNNGYSLSEHGKQLFKLLEPMGFWARHTWALCFNEESETNTVCDEKN